MKGDFKFKMPHAASGHVTFSTRVVGYFKHEMENINIVLEPYLDHHFIHHSREEVDKCIETFIEMSDIENVIKSWESARTKWKDQAKASGETV